MTDAVGLVAGLFSLIVQLHKIFSDSSEIAQRNPVIFQELRTQQTDFELWRECLANDPQLESWLQTRGQLVQQSLFQSLGLIVLKLLDLDSLARKYGLNTFFSEESESGSSGLGIFRRGKRYEKKRPVQQIQSMFEGATGLFSMERQLLQNLEYRESLRRFQIKSEETLPLLRRIKFFVFDETKFQTLLADLESLMKGLKGLYGHYDRLEQLNERRLVLRRLREVGDLPDGLRLLREGSQMNTSLRNTAQRITNRTAFDEATQQASRPLMKAYASEADLLLDPKSLNKDPLDNSRGTYGNKNVIIEWRIYDEDAFQNEFRSRVRDLARFLHNIKCDDEGFQVLHCLGYIDHTDVSDHNRKEIGFVFVRPETLDEKTLLQRFEQQPKFLTGPPLERRYEYARSIANIQFQLQVSGWLHKGIRSANIILNADSKMPLFLMGFDFSRPERLVQASESVVSSAENRFYRHQQLWNTAPGSRPRYKKEYDTFALGIVLIEIAYWMSIASLCAKVESAEAFEKHIMEEVSEPLPFMVGQSYYEAVQACLTAADNELGASGEYFLEEVLEKLEYLDRGQP